MGVNPTQTMLLLTYTPRADADERGYERWLREVDNPFFNGVDGIVLYTNWKVAAVKAGEIRFTHFDTMFVEGVDVFDRPQVQRFADGWVEQWGVDPDAGHTAVNYQVLVTEVIAEPADGRRTDWCLLLPNTPRADARERGYDQWLREVDNPFFNGLEPVASYTNFAVREARVGTVEFSDFDIFHVDGPDGFERVVTGEALEFASAWSRDWGSQSDVEDPTAGVNYSACVAKAIASPERR